MKALLYKDFVALWKYCKGYFAMCVCFLISHVFVEDMVFFRIYPMIFMGMLPSTLIAYDERDKWENLALTMPLSRKQIVTEKYLVGLILQLGTLAATGVSVFLHGVMHHSLDLDSLMMDLLTSWVLAMAAPSLMLPPVFKVGSEKGRLAYTLMMVLVMAAGVGGVVGLSLIEGTLEMGFLSVILIAVIVLGMYPTSWLLSLHWYQKREF